MATMLVFCTIFLNWYSASLTILPLRSSADNSTSLSMICSKEAMVRDRARLERTISWSDSNAAAC
jgi:hypothetical protein